MKSTYRAEPHIVGGDVICWRVIDQKTGNVYNSVPSESIAKGIARRENKVLRLKAFYARLAQAGQKGAPE